MIKKIKKNIAQYYQILVSINTHVKNININLNKNFGITNSRISSLEEEILKNSYKDYSHVDIKEIKKVKFSIITAVYNGECYLDEYFLSLCKQHNKENIEIIIVDDGSTDKSQQIISKWIDVKNLDIKYIYQNNSGQSAARNKGLEMANNEWVTFIDCDDYVSENYFFEFAKLIITHPCSIYIAPWHFYIENSNKILNSHPLKFRFEKDTLINIDTNPEYINLSASACIFRTELIMLNKIKFNEKVKPNFEDAYFYFEYLKKNFISEICFAKNVKYYYRKRNLENSTMDLSKKNPLRYLELLENGYLSCLSKFDSKTLKMAVLYELRWNCEAFIKYNIELDKNRRNKILEEIFSKYSKEDIIYAFENKLINKDFKNAILQKYFNVAFTYVENFYSTKFSNILRIVTFEENIPNLSLIVDGNFFNINELETREISLYNTGFNILKDYHIFLPIGSKNIQVSGVKKNINFEHKKATWQPDSKVLFMDRSDKADDNAESMYRFMKKNHPEFRNIFFAVDKRSSDWFRLYNEGFNLVDYNSLTFKETYKNADFIVSAAGDSPSIENFKELRKNQKFIFLQHGVIKDDLSPWLFPKKFDLIITSTYKEYDFLSRKVFPPENVVLTGLSRFDEYRDSVKKNIIVSLTWRYELRDQDMDTLINSKYVKEIEKLLHLFNEEKIIAKFILHPNMEKLKNYLSNIAGICIVLNANEVNYKTEITTAKLFITDYSSLAFDFTINNTPIIYYQFDKDSFYLNHTYIEDEAIFSYSENGLGPVSDDIESLLRYVKNYAKNNFKTEEKYLERKIEQFPYIDNNNSKRIYEEICNYFN